MGKRVLSSKLLLFVLTILMLLVFLILRMLGIADAEPEIVSVLFVGISTYIVFFLISQQTGLKKEWKIVFGVYIIKIFLVIIDIYGKNIITFIHSGVDSEMFYKVSVEYYNAQNSGYMIANQPYSHFLNGLYHIYGMNRVVAQQINVLFWVGTVFVFIKLLFFLEVEESYRIYSLLVLCFAPNYLFLSVELMRESAIIFINMLSFYFIIKWMKRGKIKDIAMAFAVAFPAIILHTGSVVLWIVSFSMLMFFNPKKQLFQISGITFVAGGLVIGLGIILFMAPHIRVLMFSYIRSSKGGGIIDYANQCIDIFRDYSGDSTYLTETYVEDYVQLLVYTVRRMYYFMFSPMPGYWRGIGDVAAFLFDSCIYLIAIVLLFVNRKNRDPLIVLFFLTFLFYAIFFCWGVSNAGTAMRHRTKLIGIVAVSIAYCINSLKTENA